MAMGTMGLMETMETIMEMPNLIIIAGTGEILTEIRIPEIPARVTEMWSLQQDRMAQTDQLL